MQSQCFCSFSKIAFCSTLKWQNLLVLPGNPLLGTSEESVAIAAAACGAGAVRRSGAAAPTLCCLAALLEPLPLPLAPLELAQEPVVVLWPEIRINRFLPRDGTKRIVEQLLTFAVASAPPEDGSTPGEARRLLLLPCGLMAGARPQCYSFFAGRHVRNNHGRREAVAEQVLVPHLWNGCVYTRRAALGCEACAVGSVQRVLSRVLLPRPAFLCWSFFLLVGYGVFSGSPSSSFSRFWCHLIQVFWSQSTVFLFMPIAIFWCCRACRGWGFTFGAVLPMFGSLLLVTFLFGGSCRYVVNCMVDPRLSY